MLDTTDAAALARATARCSDTPHWRVKHSAVKDVLPAKIFRAFGIPVLAATWP